MPGAVVVEVAGADSIAAALAYCEANPVDVVLPTYGMTGTEYGDFTAIERSAAFLAEELRLRHRVRCETLATLADQGLWRALNGRFASVVADTFGAWMPCSGCHLYLHLLRVPYARTHASCVVVAGEREHHDGRTKPNQLAPALAAYTRVLGSQGIELAQPLRHIGDSSAIQDVLGDRWIGGSPQPSCVLSGNYRGVDGACEIADMPRTYYEEFLVPVGARIAAVMPASSSVYDDIVADQLRVVRG